LNRNGYRGIRRGFWCGWRGGIHRASVDALLQQDQPRLQPGDMALELAHLGQRRLSGSVAVTVWRERLARL
jgi:hypothetical protein